MPMRHRSGSAQYPTHRPYLPLLLAATLLLLGLARVPATAQITINLIPGASLNSNPNKDQILSDFQIAASRWTSHFTNTFTFNLNVDFTSLGTNVLGQASSSTANYTYSDFYNKLSAQATSADQLAAVGTLPTGSSFSLLINRTSDNPNGSGSAKTYLDSTPDLNTQNVWMTNANAKALGLLDANSTASDASITFSSDFSFDLDPNGTVPAGQYDFVGIATHEIGHALGFISGVDVLDYNSPPVGGPYPANEFEYVTPLDLFRYSSDSANTGGGVPDWTADTRDKYFSLDKGQTSIASFSTGVHFGDGYQASHWKDNLGIGIMDPTAAAGERLAVTNTDIRALNVVGYTLVTTPEPSTGVLMAAFGVALGGVGALRYRKRRSQTHL